MPLVDFEANGNRGPLWVNLRQCGLWPAASVVQRLGACGFRVEELPGYTGATMPPSLHVYLAIKPS